MFFLGPMVALQIYLTAIFVAFVYGPWPWPVVNPARLYIFLTLAQLMIFIGYVSVGKGRGCQFRWRWTWKQMLYVSMILNAIWLYPNLVERTGHNYSTVAQVVSAVRSGFVEPGAAYKSNLEAMRNESGISLAYAFTLLFSPLLCIMFPLGVLHWRQLGFGAKFLLLLLIILDALTWVASGANKGLADIVIILPFLLFARVAMFQEHLPWRKLIGAVLVVAIFGLVFFGSFSKGQKGRANNAVYNLFDYDAGIEADQEHPVLRHLPQDAKYGVAVLMNYITQGYYGLSLCMELPYVPTYGLGNSYYTASWAGKYLGLSDIINESYPARATTAFGWDSYVRWNSLYPWLASDITFPGVILFTFFLGRVLALAWRDMIWGRNPVAVSVFCSLVTMCLYIPANNQILGFPRSGIAFIVTFTCWVRSRKVKS
jgi:hypothetical protein